MSGFEPESRHQIISTREEQISMLEKNISIQRQQQITLLPGLIQDLNEKIVKKENKMYLR